MYLRGMERLRNMLLSGLAAGLCIFALTGCGDDNTGVTHAASQPGDVKVVAGAEGCYQLGQYVQSPSASDSDVAGYKNAMLDLCDSWDQYKAALEATSRDEFKSLVDNYTYAKDIGGLQAECNEAGDTSRALKLCTDIPSGEGQSGEYLGDT